MKKAIALFAAAGLAAASNAQVTINLGDLNVTDAGISVDLNGAGIAAGTYQSYTVEVDWLAGPGTPFSNEGIWAFTDAAFTPGVDDPTLFTFFADPGAAPNSLATGDPTTLNWGGNLDVNYEGGDSLFFNALQTFGGSSATWGDTTITLSTDPAPANNFIPGAPAAVQPAAIDLGVLGNDGDNFVIDSFGSGFDTELGLYAQDGVLVSTNDDAVAGVFGPSEIDVADDTAFDGLGAGEYFIALGGFNTIYDATDFGANPDAGLGAEGGDFVVSVNGVEVATGSQPADSITWLKFTVVPAPASAALLGLGGLAAVRRRR
ncbi:MAG: PEP-CTERM sorting domain-containing protein [Planctomycetota bacterium]